MLKMLNRKEEISRAFSKLEIELENFKSGKFSRYSTNIAQTLYKLQKDYGQLYFKINIKETEESNLEKHIKYIGEFKVYSVQYKKELISYTVDLNPIYNEVTSSYDVIVKVLYGLNVLRNNWRVNCVNNLKLNMVIGELSEDNVQLPIYHKIDSKKKLELFNKKIKENSKFYLISDMYVNYSQ